MPLLSPSKPAAKKKPTVSLKLKSKNPGKPSPVITPKPAPKQQLLPLKTEYERPVLRAFETLLKYEAALAQVASVGIVLGDKHGKEQIETLKARVTEDLAQLVKIYQTYWKGVSIQ